MRSTRQRLLLVLVPGDGGGDTTEDRIELSWTLTAFQ